MNKRNITIITLIVIGLLATLAAAVPPPKNLEMGVDMGVGIGYALGVDGEFPSSQSVHLKET